MSGEPMVTAAPARPRVDVLAYPAATTTRFLLVVVSLLTAGLFVGTWTHNTTAAGRTWVLIQVECAQRALGTADEADDFDERFRDQQAFVRCTAASERLRAGYALGGLAAGALGGASLLYAAPAVLRRRRKLAEPGPKLAGARQRFDELAAEVGVVPPRLVIGSATQRDAFSFGTPGRYTVALPRAIAVKWRHADVFDPLVRHELAHVAARDVPVAWMSQSLWYALAPLLLLPVVLEVGSGDFASLADYVWRAALVAAVALLVSRATLRSREFDADVRAVARRRGGTDALARLLGSAPRPPARRGWRQVLANHPDPAARVAAIEHPELTVAVSFLDGLTTAVLTGLSLPLIVQLLTSVLAPLQLTQLATVITCLVLGPLLGATLGLALWRQSVVTRVSGTRARVLPAALGVAIGLAVGQAVSLGSTGSGWDVGHPAWLVGTLALGTGVTYVVAGLSELWADAVPGFRRARSGWIAAVLLSSLVFGLVLWIAETLHQAFEGGWRLASAVLLTIVPSPVRAAIALVLAAAVLWVVLRGRRPGRTPTWLVEGDDELPWPPCPPRLLRTTLLTGVAGGVAAVVLVLTYRALEGSVQTAQGMHALLLLVVAGAGGATLALSALVPRRGPGLALLAGPLAVLIAAPAQLLARGGGLSAALVDIVVWSPLGLGVAAVMIAGGAAAVGARLFRGAAAVAVPVVAALLGGTLGTWVIVEPPNVTPVVEQPGGPVPGPHPAEEFVVEVAIRSYLDKVVPEVQTRLLTVFSELGRLGTSGADPATVAAQIDDGPITDLRELEEELQDLDLPDAQLAAAHEDLLATLDLQQQALSHLTDHLRTSDPAAEAEWEQVQGRSDEHFEAWTAELEALGERVQEE